MLRSMEGFLGKSDCGLTAYGGASSAGPACNHVPDNPLSWTTMLNTTSGIVTDKTLAKVLSLSVAYVRKDRLTTRILPFFTIGRSVRYDVQTVLASLKARSEGGQQ